MYSVKPGRGQSLTGAIVGLVLGVPFAICWLTVAVTKGAPGFFVFFGIAFLVLILCSVFAGFYNAVAKDRVSQYDITTSAEESDPFASLAPRPASPPATRQAAAQSQYCPFCGAAVQSDFKFCPKCGKPQPGLK